jgi:DNA primase catalytic core
MDIKEIKSRLPIGAVLAHYGLKPDKANRLLCPFHADKTPSLQIYPKTNTYCCFSSNCDAGTGDQIQFIERKENCDKYEAIEKAKALIGNTTAAQPTEPAKLYIEAAPMERIAVFTKLFKYFSKALPLTGKAVDYLAGRNINYKLHEVGYNSGDWHHKLNEQHFLNNCAGYGLLKPKAAKGYSVWARDCIIFPLKDEHNKIVSLYGRSITNDADSRHFYLAGRTGLYPGYPALTTKQLILTESIIDAVSLLQQPEIKANYTVLSLYGTNGLTDEHLKCIVALPQLGEIIFMFDADEAGEAATQKHYHTLKQLLPEVKISKAQVPQGEDINSVLQSHEDAAVLMDLITAREELFFSIEKNVQTEDATTLYPAVSQHNQKLNTQNAELLIYDNGELYVEVLGGIKLTGLDRMKVTLKVRHKEKLHNPQWYSIDLYNQVQREQTISSVSETLELSHHEATQGFISLITELEQHRLQKMESLTPKLEKRPEMTAAARATAIGELKKEQLLDRHNKMIGLTGIVGEEKNRMIAYLIYSFRRQQNPLHIMFLGASGSGKTYLQEKVSELIPAEDKIEITQITENALYYFKQEELKHKLILFEDLDGALQVFYPLRELQTKKRISKTVTLKDSKGNLKTITIVVEGPVCISGCTTKERIYEDNANRCVLLYIDMSKEQDSRIMGYHAAVESGQTDREREGQYRELFNNIQRVLRPIEVHNPYSQLITLPDCVFRPRRTITLLRGFIKAIAYYHQYQREVKKDKYGQPYIEVIYEDVEQGFYYMKDVLFSKSDELSRATRDFFERLKRHITDKQLSSFKMGDIRKCFRMEPRTVQRYMKELSQYGYIRRISGQQGRTGFEYSVVDDQEYGKLQTAIDVHISGVLQAIRDYKSDINATMRH